jgi:hypothetical protein
VLLLLQVLQVFQVYKEELQLFQQFHQPVVEEDRHLVHKMLEMEVQVEEQGDLIPLVIKEVMEILRQ